jgi:hypothetical protein
MNPFCALSGRSSKRWTEPLIATMPSSARPSLAEIANVTPLVRFTYSVEPYCVKTNRRERRDEKVFDSRSNLLGADVHA